MVKIRNSRILRTIPLLIVVFFASFPAYAKYGGGRGQPNDPYQIATAADLILLGESPEDYDKHFILTDDIDLDPNLPGRKVFDKAVIAPDVNDSASGFQGTLFTGVFDGNGHTISNLTTTGTGYLGLFGQLASGAELMDLGVVDVKITGSGDYIGGLAGYNLGIMTQCYSAGTVSGNRNVGGLVGHNDGAVTKCYSTGAVNCIGYGPVGGLVGYNGGILNHCYSASAVRGHYDIGGLVGSNIALVTLCYSTGTVRGTFLYSSSVGGLVGENREGDVIHSYSTSTVNGWWYVGGLVGSNTGGVVQSYSTGAVSGRLYVGGLVGSGGHGILHSVWDIETSGQVTSAGGIGLTTASMQNIRTYLDIGWDWVGEMENGTCEIWQMPEGGGYPVLTVFSGYSPPQLPGLGTPKDPYLISDAMELGAMVHYSPHAYYRLAASINLSGIHWSTDVIPWLAGTFDGNNLTISHLTITSGGYLGLFGRLASGCEVKNLGVVDVNIVGSGSYVGGLAGVSAGTLTQCYSTGTVTVRSTGQWSSSVGGLVGQNHKGDMIHSYSTCTVNGEWYVGGLVGSSGGDVLNCFSAGTVTGDYCVGGLVGENWYGNITHCYSTGTVSGGVEVGGLLGLHRGTVTQCYSTGAVSGNDAVGGLVGRNGIQGAMPYPGYIDKSYSIATVRGETFVGGLVGDNRVGAVNYCYSMGTVIGHRYVGGLAGFIAYSRISNCYSVGLVIGTGEYVGGLVGGGWSPNVTTASFWDMQTSCQATSAGGTGKTTAEMQMASTFLEAGWDFVDETANGTEDIWWINEGKDYPRLWWEAHN